MGRCAYSKFRSLQQGLLCHELIIIYYVLAGRPHVFYNKHVYLLYPSLRSHPAIAFVTGSDSVWRF